MKRDAKGQSVIEYALIMALVLALMVSSDFIGRLRTCFYGYFNNAIARMK